jgi:hypothetical protein
MRRASLFIGSSSEGLGVAQKIRSQLKSDAEITIWHEGVFGLGEGTLEGLVDAVSMFDFAILILTPDDLTKSRGRSLQSPRDNVLFECGLFMGRLGRHRTFIVYDSDAPIKLPSDLAGVTVATYRGNRRDNNVLAAVGEACDPIRDAIYKLGPLPIAATQSPRSLAPSANSIPPAALPSRVTAWFLGSYSGLDEAEERFTKKFIPMIATGLAHAGVRVVMGESEMLIDLAKRYRDSAIGGELAIPNPIIPAGKLRQCDLRERFIDTIGVIPDLAVVIGGGVERGRVREECVSAKEAGIPILPVPVTGGYARMAETTFSLSASDRSLLEKRPTNIDVGDIASTIVRLVESCANCR